MEVFLYGTLMNPEHTESKFDVTLVGPSVLHGATKVGNNVVPDEEDSVRGNLFSGSIKSMDDYETSFGYQSLTAPIEDEEFDEARFYAMLVESPYEFPDAKIELLDGEIPVRRI